MPDFAPYKAQAQHYLDILVGWLSSPQFYAQVIAIIAAVLIARIVAKQILAQLWLFNTEPTEGRFLRYLKLLYSCRDLLRPIIVVAFLAVAASVCDAAIGSSWLVRLAGTTAVVLLLYSVINRFISNPLFNVAARWIGMPLAAIYMFGQMGNLLGWLDSVAFQAGNIRISMLALIKAAGFGGALFWAGRVSSNAGQKVIRDQQTVDVQTRELAAKALELVVFAIAALLLFNVLGMDLAALTVFSGALGVGLGFGLQQIASNFISGIIILLERSLKIGDYIELEDGRAGTLQHINMRSSTLTTYDGKDIMVPNERFITTRFVNWTHTDPRQRYEVPFSVVYDTDIRKVAPLIVEAIAKVPSVLQEPEQPACELKSFGDSGVRFTAKFWVNGIDDGQNNYTSDVMYAIWDALKAAKIEMPSGAQYVRVETSNVLEKVK